MRLTPSDAAAMVREAGPAFVVSVDAVEEVQHIQLQRALTIVPIDLKIPRVKCQFPAQTVERSVCRFDGAIRGRKRPRITEGAKMDSPPIFCSVVCPKAFLEGLSKHGHFAECTDGAQINIPSLDARVMVNMQGPGATVETLIEAKSQKTRDLIATILEGLMCKM